MLDGNIFVLELLGFVLGLGEEPVEARGDEDLVGRAGWPGDFRQPVQFLLEPRTQRVDVDPGVGQYGTCQAALLFQQAGKQMLDIELLMAVADSLALRRADRLLEFFRKTIDVHIPILYRIERVRCGPGACLTMIKLEESWQPQNW